MPDELQGPDVPKATYELTLRISGCDWTRVAERLVAEAEHIREHGPECRSLWGGTSGGGYVEITHRPEVTEESYRAALLHWSEQYSRARADEAPVSDERAMGDHQ